MIIMQLNMQAYIKKQQRSNHSGRDSFERNTFNKTFGLFFQFDGQKVDLIGLIKGRPDSQIKMRPGLFGPNIDYVVRHRINDARKADIWIKDQYYNPHETWHSIGEVQGWFEENDIEYLNCSPAILGTDGEDAEIEGDLFRPTSSGNAYQRVVTQMSWLGTIAREGALFDIIGRKKG